jgi:hypothetical protein
MGRLFTHGTIDFILTEPHNPARFLETRMRVVVSRMASLALAVASVSLLGCGGQSADRAAQDQLDQAGQSAVANQLDAAQSAADSAAGSADISPEMSAKAHTLSAQLHLQRAHQYLSQAQEAELSVGRVLADLRLATAHVQSIQLQITAIGQYDPTQTEQMLSEKVAQIQNGTGDSTLSLPAVQTEVARLQADIQANRDQAQTLNQDKIATLEQADQLQQKSLGENGQQSVDDVAAAAEIRRKSALTAIAIDKLDSEWASLQADLRTIQARQGGIQQAIEDYNKQIADLDLAWKSAQQNIEDEKKAIAAIAGPAAASAAPAAAPQSDLPPAPPAPTTIADQCAQLKGMVAEAWGLRDKASTELKAAIQGFNASKSAEAQFRESLTPSLDGQRTPPGEKTALQQLRETYASAGLAAADAEQTLATNYAAQAMIALQLKESLTAAQAAFGSNAPAAIADCLSATASPSVDDFAALATDQFREALEHFDSLTTQTLPGMGAQSRKTAAKAGKMIAAFGAEQLSLALGNRPVAGGNTPHDLQSMINDLARDVAQENSTMLPNVPYSLAAPPAGAGTPQ